MNGMKIAMVVVLSLLLLVVAIMFATAERTPVTQQGSGNETTGVLYGDPVENEVSHGVDDVAVETLSRSKVAWGVGPDKNDKNQPLDCIDAQNKYAELGGYFVFPSDEKVIYLTFDLGYENGYTEDILDAMDSRGVKGTFFITMDYALEAPEIVERILRNGHTLANHTVKHPSIPDVSDERVRAEIMDLHNYILEQYNYEMTLFRYPMGEFSEQSLKLIDDLGYKSIFWSFAYVDWKTDAQPGTSTGMSKTTGSLHDGAIYLLHAVSSTNAAIMGDFLDEAAGQGYSFGLVDERLGLVAAKEPAILE